MPETLLSHSEILLFGRVVEDLHIKATEEPEAAKSSGQPGAVEGQLAAEQPNFARVYGFGFEGLYHVLPVPALFLVHGPGVSAETAASGLRPSAGATTEGSVGGVLLPDDLMVWTYDKADYSIRMDVQSGMFEQLLLGKGPSGPEARGMSVGGMSVSGMSVQGMSVGGMSVRGMSLRGDKKE
ncbi:hypothetical protein RGQ15_20410 [Paracoccus sp. MBLB3053]|uniref:Uncharacterized protein n=1 Tax=Paracoccus aurantius TaxID=3073814 RepID=A0ABU2HXY9_9RHOB|nr:hypothetical protein [Paracoccus sp. MBLB3053]MDS9469915.1 hypothetical protein [Paracoccus sp. MBLB3053]